MWPGGLKRKTAGLNFMTSVAYEAPVRRALPQPQGAISYLEWGSEGPHKIPLHFAHANGFNGQTYSRILSGLSDRFHIRAWDARGHGATTLPADPAQHRNWYVYRDDLIAMIEPFVKATGRKVILAGHSMGGTASVMAAAARPDLVRGLVLADPVMFPSRARYIRLLSQWLGLGDNPLALGAERLRIAPLQQRREGRLAGRSMLGIEQGEWHMQNAYGPADIVPLRAEVRRLPRRRT